MRIASRNSSDTQLRDTRLLKCITFALTALVSLGSSATEVSDSATIVFQQSKSNLDMSLGHNRAELDSLTKFMDRYSAPDSAYSLSRILVVGGASPEGSVSINERLSRQRAETIFDYFSARETLPDSVTSFKFLGRDWRGLRAMVEFDTRVPYRREVISLLDEIIDSTDDNNVASDRGLARLRRLHGGVPYRYLFTHEFPQLRASKLYVEYTANPVSEPAIVPEVVPTDTIVEETVEIEHFDEITVPVDNCRPFYMGLKTNMLYDVLALPSIGAEFYLGKNWTVGANWFYGWWDVDRRHRYWRAYGGDINVRRWFGRAAEEKPLTGHHIGVYAGVVTYDFEFGGKGYMGGLPHKTLWDRCNYMAGIEYGYSLPVGRRLNIDFTIGIGYLGGKYLEYKPKDNHYVWQSTKHLNWVGPTKLEVSLVWLIGCDNFNRSKKGDK